MLIRSPLGEAGKIIKDLTRVRVENMWPVLVNQNTGFVIMVKAFPPMWDRLSQIKTFYQNRLIVRQARRRRNPLRRLNSQTYDPLLVPFLV